ncbi:MAG TPA: hypothetical protein VF643_12815 [Sphingomonas sp.]|jgi:hypothetical protein
MTAVERSWSGAVATSPLSYNHCACNEDGESAKVGPALSQLSETQAIG